MLRMKIALPQLAPDILSRFSLKVSCVFVSCSLNLTTNGKTAIPVQSGTEINDRQRSVNDYLGAPLINSPDSSIATENTIFSKDTKYGKEQNALALIKTNQLRASNDAEEAERIIKEVLGLDASPSVKTEFRKASLLRLASHSERKKAYEEAQKYLAQFLTRYPDDPLIPVVLLRQGDLFRKMGAYDLERQKYYDVIKSAPKVKLDEKYGLGYVQRVALLARTQIADSFYEEAGKLPDYQAREKYASASEMYARLVKMEQVNPRVVSLKYIRSLYSQESHAAVYTEGQAFFEKFKTGSNADEDEVRYLMLDSSRKLTSGSQDYLDGYRSWFESSPYQGNEIDALKWRLKAARDLADELFKGGRYVESREFYVALAGLLCGEVKQPQEYLQLMLDIRRALGRGEAMEADSVSSQEISNGIKPMLLGIQKRAKASKIKSTNIDAVLKNSEESVVGLPMDWDKAKPMLQSMINELAGKCEEVYTMLLPILYRIALCSEKVPSDTPLAGYESIRVGVMDVEANDGAVKEQQIFSNQGVKLHIMGQPQSGKDPVGVLVCIWNGVPSAGMQLSQEEGAETIKVLDFVGLASLPGGTNLHEKALPIKLLSDMSSWRIGTLKWQERFNKQLAELGR